ncbi:hypothetical protein GALL_56690 [mine drainage metagenome]|uniref:Uncharacterized protein n=1 Tax=mine drainage metagenome TaxID=410659 RepID=A0A1J5THU9_9ZZZZ
MKDITVMVIPELKEYKNDAFTGEVIYIHRKLGEPKFKEHNTRYIAPYWLDVNQVERIYQILEVRAVGDSYEVYLGNSFILKDGWDNIGQRRKYEYHSLESFGFSEAADGFLVPLKQKKSDSNGNGQHLIHESFL